MSEHKAVVWFGNDPQPNTFFLGRRSVLGSS